MTECLPIYKEHYSSSKIRVYPDDSSGNCARINGVSLSSWKQDSRLYIYYIGYSQFPRRDSGSKRNVVRGDYMKCWSGSVTWFTACHSTLVAWYVAHNINHWYVWARLDSLTFVFSHTQDKSVLQSASEQSWSTGWGQIIFNWSSLKETDMCCLIEGHFRQAIYEDNQM